MPTSPWTGSGVAVGEVTRKWDLRRHFADRHQMDLVSVFGEGRYPRCVHCGMQTSLKSLNSGHLDTKTCRERGQRRRQHEAAANAALALREQFTAYGDVLERVEVFKYLGRLLAMDDNDAGLSWKSTG